MSYCRSLVVVVVFSLFGWFFGRAVCGEEFFAFRDTGHFYFPLFSWTENEWAAGRVPLWNDLDNTGVPAVADATASIFYPGKLIFLLPLEYHTKFKLFVSLHVLLAAGGAYLAATYFKVRPSGSGICAVSYAFGGIVLSQHANVVYLVGAGWLPLALVSAHRMLKNRCWTSAVVLAVILAMMILGGDPQTAYNAMIVIVFHAVMLWRADAQEKSSQVTDDHGDQIVGCGWQLLAAIKRPGTSRRMISSRWLLVLAVPALAGCLAAIQIIPTLEWSHFSRRAAFDQPRSVYEVPEFIQRKNDDSGTDVGWGSALSGLFGIPRHGTHDREIYHFSLGPWRCMESLWPNVGGRMYPNNRRWLNALPGEGRVWNPSLYMGLIVLLLAASVIRDSRTNLDVQWVLGFTVFAIAASFGWYGLGWLVHELQPVFAPQNPEAVTIGQPVGGFYWLLVVLLPGYALFRYPAKWLIFASLGISLLAANGWERRSENLSNGRLPWLIKCVGGLTLVALFVQWIGRSWLETQLENATPDFVFGPIDQQGAIKDLQISLGHTLCTLVACWLLLCVIGKKQQAKCGPLALILLALDLAVANSWLIQTVPFQLVKDSKPIAAQQTGTPGNSPGQDAGFHRVWSPTVLPRQWSRVGSVDRFQEIVLWNTRSSSPRYHLYQGIPVFNATNSLSHLEFRVIMELISRHRQTRLEGTESTSEKLLAAFSVRDVGRSPFPRAWLVQSSLILPALESNTPVATRKAVQECLFADGPSQDFRHLVFLESEQGHLAEMVEATDISGITDCQIVNADSQSVEVHIHQPQPGILVLNDLYYPGWAATVHDCMTGERRQAEILRANRVMRAVSLPAGEFRVRFQYQPTSFRIGCWVSGLTCFSLVICGGMFWRQRRREKPPEKKSGV